MTFAQSQNSTEAHQSAVTALAPLRTQTGALQFFSAGRDGFLVQWTDDGRGEHYQVTDREIQLIAVSPNGTDVAIYETDGARINRISVWNWQTLTRKFSRRFSDSITALTYSANGTYLIAGTATVDGAVVMRATNGTIVDAIKDPTGIVSYIQTSATERTAVMYSPSGNISYYNLRTGKMTARFPIEQGMSQPIIFNNGLFLAGVRDDTVYICYALTGQTIASFQCQEPLFITTPDDSDLCYIDSNGRGTSALCVISNKDNKSVNTPEIRKVVSGPRGRQALTAGFKSGETIVLGGKSGELYRTTVHGGMTTEPLAVMTERMYEKIYDVAPVEDDFYFLTKTALYRSSYDTGVVTKLADNPGHTGLIVRGDTVVLWSEETREPVQELTVSTGELRTLFTPQASLRSLKLFGTKLIDIENYSTVNVYDFEIDRRSHVYTGTALQDAVIMDNDNVYVAKSSATLPAAPLISVNMTTGETVALPIHGNVCFSLSLRNENVYGIIITENGQSQSTYVFSYDIQTRRESLLIRLSDEDLSAFTAVGSATLYTNICGQLHCYNLATRRTIQFNRSASLPLKIAENEIRTVVLNRDGSISWHNATTPHIVADWYLTTDGRWFEF
ncbi:MAG: hypothetical protein IJ191_08045 [Treponema sp.]|nr:hypothetical protein [Treponema sp.]